MSEPHKQFKDAILARLHSDDRQFYQDALQGHYTVSGNGKTWRVANTDSLREAVRAGASGSVAALDEDGGLRRVGLKDLSELPDEEFAHINLAFGEGVADRILKRAADNKRAEFAEEGFFNTFSALSDDALIPDFLRDLSDSDKLNRQLQSEGSPTTAMVTNLGLNLATLAIPAAGGAKVAQALGAGAKAVGLTSFTTSSVVNSAQIAAAEARMQNDDFSAETWGQMVAADFVFAGVLKGAGVAGRAIKSRVGKLTDNTIGGTRLREGAEEAFEDTVVDVLSSPVGKTPPGVTPAPGNKTSPGIPSEGLTTSPGRPSAKISGDESVGPFRVPEKSHPIHDDMMDTMISDPLYATMRDHIRDQQTKNSAYLKQLEEAKEFSFANFAKATPDKRKRLFDLADMAVPDHVAPSVAFLRQHGDEFGNLQDTYRIYASDISRGIKKLELGTFEKRLTKADNIALQDATLSDGPQKILAYLRNNPSDNPRIADYTKPIIEDALSSLAAVNSVIGTQSKVENLILKGSTAEHMLLQQKLGGMIKQLQRLDGVGFGAGSKQIQQGIEELQEVLARGFASEPVGPMRLIQAEQQVKTAIAQAQGKVNSKVQKVQAEIADANNAVHSINKSEQEFIEKRFAAQQREQAERQADLIKTQEAARKASAAAEAAERAASNARVKAENAARVSAAKAERAAEKEAVRAVAQDEARRVRKAADAKRAAAAAEKAAAKAANAYKKTEVEGQVLGIAMDVILGAVGGVPGIIGGRLLRHLLVGNARAHIARVSKGVGTAVSALNNSSLGPPARKFVTASSVLMSSKEEKTTTVEQLVSRVRGLSENPLKFVEQLEGYTGEPMEGDHGVGTLAGHMPVMAVYYLQNLTPDKPVSQWTGAEKDTFLSASEMISNPYYALNHVAAGTINKQHVDTLVALFPNIYADMVMGMLEQLNGNIKQLPRQSQLIMGRFLQAPIDTITEPMNDFILSQRDTTQPSNQPIQGARSKLIHTNGKPSVVDRLANR